MFVNRFAFAGCGKLFPAETSIKSQANLPFASLMERVRVDSKQTRTQSKSQTCARRFKDIWYRKCCVSRLKI